MSESLQSHGRHCPFLNRTDPRCSRHFSLDQLQHTFEHCFGEYEGCGVYLELLYERRVRRAAARLQSQVLFGAAELEGAIAGEMDDGDTNPDQNRYSPQHAPHKGPVFVQLHIVRHPRSHAPAAVGG